MAGKAGVKRRSKKDVIITKIEAVDAKISDMQKKIETLKEEKETFVAALNAIKEEEDKSNFSLSNLEWTTNKLNTQYHLQELHKNTPFFNNRKLTKKDIDFIKNNKGKISYSKLAELFNVSKTTIVNVMNDKLYNNGVW